MGRESSLRVCQGIKPLPKKQTCTMWHHKQSNTKSEGSSHRLRGDVCNASQVKG